MDIIEIINQLDHNSPLFYLALTAVVLYKAFSLVEPFVEHKVGAAKLDKLTKRSEFILHKAKLIVSEVAGMAGLSNADRRAKAVDMLVDVLTKHGINVSKHDLSIFVETAYRYMKSNDYLKDVPVKTTDAPENLSDEELKKVLPTVTTAQDAE